MNHNIVDRPEDFLREKSGRNALAPVSNDDDAPQLNELLFDIGVAVAAYLTLALVLSVLVSVLHL
ncbi:MAG TPA: hypothetical protein VL492_12880 [Methylovirgula sp.]|jgi:hypothetical protein|nr:hypothetical protein [Methylovirgula sp.]